MTTDSGSTITLADLQNVLSIIDLASTRGAFKGNELATVGVLYNKLGAFIQLAQTNQNTVADDSTTE